MDFEQKDDIWSWSKSHAKKKYWQRGILSWMFWFVVVLANFWIGCAKKKVGQNDNKQPQSWVWFDKVRAGK